MNIFSFSNIVLSSLQDKMAPLSSLSKFMSPPPAHLSSANLSIDPSTGKRAFLLFENVLIFSFFLTHNKYIYIYIVLFSNCLMMR
jgi:hypothetical protein